MPGQPGAPSGRPVFYTETASRWRLFLGALRIAAFFLFLAVLVVAFALMRASDVARPVLPGEKDGFRQVLEPAKILSLEHAANISFERVRPQLTEAADFDYENRMRSSPAKAAPIRLPIRGAWFSADDEFAWFSLLRHVDALNVLFPDWLSFSGDSDEVVYEPDQRALSLLRTHRIPILPVLSDDPAGRAEDRNVRRILAHPENRRKFVASLAAALEREQFSGVTVCFPSFGGEDQPMRTAFLRELADAAKPKGLLVAIGIPVNEGWNAAAAGIEFIAGLVDYVVLLAHDLHTFDTGPGPLAPLSSVAGWLEEARRAIPPGKLILSLASHGYDWPEEAEGRRVSHSEAIENAEDRGARVFYDAADAALHYEYPAGPASRREVWAADAASVFNAMRLAADGDLSGVVLRRLGCEDERVWTFYSHPMTREALKARPIAPQQLAQPHPAADIDYMGEGDVLASITPPIPGEIAVTMDAARQMIATQEYRQLPASFVVHKRGRTPGKVVLTFDDGPDGKYTPHVLDILEREKVPATFFIVGVNADRHLRLVRRMYEEGHEIGNHTFTHPNLSKVGTKRAGLELDSNRRLIESVTGHSTVLFRPPFSADSEPATIAELLPVLAAQERRYLMVGESIDPRDWEPGIKMASILDRIRNDQSGGNVVLLHDAGGMRAETVKVLPDIIRFYREQGYEFTSVAGLLGLHRDDVMPPLQSRVDRFLVDFNWRIAWATAGGAKLLWWLFLAATGLSIARTLAVAILALTQMRRRARTPPARMETRPLVSVIVPAYNEEVTCAATVRTLLGCDWPALEILFVDDGSTDRTFETIRAAFVGEPRVRAITKPNGGKASALNLGVAEAAGEYLVCIDADTQLDPGAIRELMRAFDGPRVVAVAGNVKIGNEVNLLTRWQAIEYIASQSFDRHAFDLLNAIMVVPGAIGAFRKDALRAVGGFTTDTLAEDCELTVRLLRTGGIVRYQPTAIAHTEAPETIRAFMKQRFRWSFGILQTVWKHRDAAFDPKFAGLGLAALPNAIVFQFMLPLLAPIADLTMLVSIYAGFWRQTLAYYLAFTLVDLLGGLVAFRCERERLGRLWALLPQRFGYRQIVYVVLIRSCLAALRGTLVSWGILHRTGHAQIMAAGKEGA